MGHVRDCAFCTIFTSPVYGTRSWLCVLCYIHFTCVWVVFIKEQIVTDVVYLAMLQLWLMQRLQEYRYDFIFQQDWAFLISYGISVSTLMLNCLDVGLDELLQITFLRCHQFTLTGLFIMGPCQRSCVCTLFATWFSRAAWTDYTRCCYRGSWHVGESMAKTGLSNSRLLWDQRFTYWTPVTSVIKLELFIYLDPGSFMLHSS